MRPIRLGIAGLGMAGGVMADVVAGHPAFVLAGAADPNPDLRARFTADRGLPADPDIAGLLARPEIEALYIATPHGLHAAHVALAAAAGKHMVVEKPMALTLADCDAMIAAAKTAGVVLMVGHTHGFDPAVSRMRALIEDGEVGRPVLITALNYTNFLYRPRRPEELDPKAGGGVLFNQLPHQIDAVRLIAGARLISVKAAGWTLDPARPVVGTLTAMLGFEGGASAVVTYSGYDRFDSDEWHGWISTAGAAKSPAHGAAQRSLAGLTAADEQRLRWETFGYGGEAFRTPDPVAQPHAGVLLVTCERADLKSSAQGVQVFDQAGVREIDLPRTAARPGYAAVLDELAAAVREGQAPRRDGAFARATVEACLAIEQSLASGLDIRL